MDRLDAGTLPTVTCVDPGIDINCESLQFCPPVQIGQPLQSPDSRDAAIFALLDRNVELKYHLLQQQMQVMDAADVARDSQKTNFSPDNKTMDVYCSWVVPFDVAKITEISWQWAQIEYIDCHVEQVHLLLA